MTINRRNTFLLPTAFLGNIEYFYYLNIADRVIIEQQETWPKQTYRNRTVIVTDKGSLDLIVPVSRINGSHTKTKDIAITYRENWPLKHWRSIETAYQNSPFFLYYADGIKQLFFSKISNLVEMNTLLTKAVCEMIDIDTEIELSSNFSKPSVENVNDLRYKFSPKQPSTLVSFPEYTQVFSDKQPFIPNAGILDLLFCLGPESKHYLTTLE